MSAGFTLLLTDSTLCLLPPSCSSSSSSPLSHKWIKKTKQKQHTQWCLPCSCTFFYFLISKKYCVYLSFLLLCFEASGLPRLLVLSSGCFHSNPFQCANKKRKVRLDPNSMKKNIYILVKISVDLMLVMLSFSLYLSIPHTGNFHCQLCIVACAANKTVTPPDESDHFTQVTFGLWKGNSN